MLYDSVEEAINRLVGTVVTYGGEPVYVDRISAGEPFNVRLFRFPFNGESRITVPLDDPLFKRFQSPPIGFCNYFGPAPGIRQTTNAVWCERIPSRQRRQGLSGETFSATSIGDGFRHDFQHMYTSDGFREMVMGEYPTFDEAIGRLVPNSSIAVDRHFAIRMSDGGYVSLFFKRDEIGLFIRGNLYLRADRQHMIETIVENRNLPDRIEVM